MADGRHPALFVAQIKLVAKNGKVGRIINSLFLECILVFRIRVVIFLAQLQILVLVFLADTRNIAVLVILQLVFFFKAALGIVFPASRAAAILEINHINVVDQFAHLHLETLVHRFKIFEDDTRGARTGGYIEQFIGKMRRQYSLCGNRQKQEQCRQCERSDSLHAFLFFVKR